ncbi:MAG: diguanylate cyclase domain-containing protein [Geminicoccales bacterium]
MHLFSDSWTALIYFSVPLGITALFLCRRNLFTRSLAVLIIGFILACGLIHIIEFVLYDEPMKSLQAAIELMAGAVATATTMLLWSSTPRTKGLPGPVDLAEENAWLRADIDKRSMNEEFMRRAYEQQEQQVETATKALRLAYDKLNANRERLAFALEGANDGLWDWTLADKSIYFSARLADMLGHEPKDMTMSSEARWALLHQDDRAIALNAFEAHLEGKSDLYESEHRLRTREGRHIWVLDRGKVVERDRLGRAVRAVGTTSDITRRKSAELALQASNQKVKRLYEQTPALLYSVDAEGGLLTVTRNWLEMMGYRRDEVLGRRSVAFMTESSRRRLTEEVLPTFRDKGTIADVPCRMVRKNGETFDALLSATSEYDRSGKVVRSLAVLIDVTERNRALRLAEESEARLRLALEGAREGLWDWNIGTGDLFISPQAGAILGYGPDQLPDDISFWQTLLAADDRVRFATGLEDLSRGKIRSLVFELEIQRPGADQHWIDWRASSISPTASMPGRRIIGIFRDITARKRAELQTAYRALHDGLTSLPNRQSFEEQLQRAHAEAELTGRPLAVMFLDLDRFKAVNDSFGHEQGDQLLIEVGRRLQRCLRKSDLVARFGGDEFAILARDYKKPHDVSILADRIIKTVGRSIRIDDQDVMIGVSIGITSFPEDRSPADVLVANADLALHRAKQAGRGGWQRYHAGMPTRRRHRSPSSDAVLYDALKNGEFEVMYEPTINISDLSIRALLAIPCWHHPVRGTLPAKDFIEEMLNSPFLRFLVEWSLKSAVEQFATWRDLGLPTGIKLAMTVPTPLLHAQNLAETIERSLVQLDLEPPSLTLEVAEGALSDDIVASGILQKLHAKGFHLAIDDVGKGALPLSVLHTLPIKQLNIHGPLINSDHDRKQQAVARAIIAIAANLGLSSIAKDIETSEQLALITELGGSAVRGPLFHEPATAIDTTRWLSRWQERRRHNQDLDLLRHG